MLTTYFFSLALPIAIAPILIRSLPIAVTNARFDILRFPQHSKDS